jgi:hypothetical protein
VTVETIAGRGSAPCSQYDVCAAEITGVPPMQTRNPAKANIISERERRAGVNDIPHRPLLTGQADEAYVG